MPMNGQKRLEYLFENDLPEERIWKKREMKKTSSKKDM